jgi:endonuclease YncB( thermonuclease family)
MIILAIALQAATCTPVLIYDADTLTCADGAKLRVAGVNARELKGAPCPRDFPCPAMSAVQARQVTVRLLGATVIGSRPTGHLVVRAPAIRYWPVDRNRDRIVARVTTASGGDLRCSLVAARAVADWPKFVRRYRLHRCPT